jgi:hypothetical protein
MRHGSFESWCFKAVDYEGRGKIMGENLLRVMRANEAVAREAAAQ